MTNKFTVARSIDMSLATLGPDEVRAIIVALTRTAEIAAMDMETIRQLPDEDSRAFRTYVEGLMGIYRAAEQLQPGLPVDSHLASLLPAFTMIGLAVSERRRRAKIYANIRAKVRAASDPTS
jgi:hypothetical protein